MAEIVEIAAGIYRVSVYVAPAQLLFNQFIVDDVEPLLFHTGLRGIFDEVRDAVARVVDDSRIRWFAFSHFEADECGPLNQWLALAPGGEPACSITAKLVSIDDFADKPARALADGELFSTGAHRFRFLQTPHLPHGWDAGLLFEETTGTLLCSDLFHQAGKVEPLIESEELLLGRARATLEHYRTGPLANYMPYTKHTDGMLQRLADLKPQVCATMHGSAYRGDGERALRRLAEVHREVLG